jgi:hypothetical protein
MEDTIPFEVEPLRTLAGPLYAGVSLPSDAPTGPPIALTPAQLAEHAGDYEMPSHRFTFRVAGDHLEVMHQPLHPPGQIEPSNLTPFPTAPLEFTDIDEAVIGSVSQPIQKVTFVQRPDGTVGWLFLSPRLLPHVR